MLACDTISERPRGSHRATGGRPWSSSPISRQWFAGFAKPGTGNGANLRYHVIGFAGFNLQVYEFKGNSGSIDGYFVKVDWQGTGTSDTSTYFGATTSRLVG